MGTASPWQHQGDAGNDRSAGAAKRPPRVLWPVAPSPVKRRRWTKPLLMMAALAAADLIVYAPTRHYGLVRWDDPGYVAIPQVRGGLTWPAAAWALTTGSFSNWHPLTWLSYMADVQFWGPAAGVHHAGNVLLHVASTLLLFGLLYRLTASLSRSAFVAALFGLHPLHVESVAWVAERKDVLSTFFELLALWAYVGYVRRPALRRYLLVMVLFAFGLMSKPMVVTFPLVLLLLDFWPLRRLRLPPHDGQPAAAAQFPAGDLRLPNLSLTRAVAEKIPLLALSIASSLVTIVVQRRWGAMTRMGALPLVRRLENVLTAYVTYIAKSAWPAGLAAFYPYPQSVAAWRVAEAVLLLGAASIAAIWAARRHPYIPVGWFWFLGTLVPAIGLIQVGDQAMADRYMYVPLIGLGILAAWGVPDLLARWKRGRVALAAAACLVLLACGAAARRQVRYWATDTALWRHTLQAIPENYRAHNNLGVALAMDGKLAISYYSEAIRLKPGFAEAHNNLGAALANQGKYSQAITQYAEAMRLQPDYADPYNNMGVALANQGKLREAAALYAEAVRINSGYAEAHHNLGAALAHQGKFSEAIPHYAEAARLQPDYGQAYDDWGIALSSQGQFGAATVKFQEALRLLPGNAEAHNHLGFALAMQGRQDDAIAQYAEAVRLNPGYAEAQNNWGAALASKGRYDEAVAHYYQALRLKPSYPDPYRNIQIALANQSKLEQPSAGGAPKATVDHASRAAALARQNKPNEALFEYMRALRDNPNQPEAWRGLNHLIERRLMRPGQPSGAAPAARPEHPPRIPPAAAALHDQ